MKTTISNIGQLQSASIGKKSASSAAKQNLEKAHLFHKYITERRPLEYLNGYHNGIAYTSTRLVWSNEKSTIAEIS